jgi:hypothetical protein
LHGDESSSGASLRFVSRVKRCLRVCTTSAGIFCSGIVKAASLDFGQFTPTEAGIRAKYRLAKEQRIHNDMTYINAS